MTKVVYLAGISFFLTLIFVGLKNHSIIDWSWFWVISPVFLFYVITGCYIIYRGVKK